MAPDVETTAAPGPGRGCSTLTFDSRAAMEATRQSATRIREQAIAAGVEITAVTEFDLEIAHLRLPELV